MIEPNRLTAPGERAALERVEVLVERIDGLRVEMFAPSQLALLEPDEHARLFGQLEAEADRCGRRELLDDVCERVRVALRARMAQPTRLDPIGRYPLTPTRPEDVAAIVMTVTDAVAVAVMEDRLSAEVAGELSAPGRTLLGLPPLGNPALASASARPGFEEPTAEDWAEAAGGDTAVDPGAPVGGTRWLRIGFFTIVAVLGAPAVLAVGISQGDLALGLIAAIAVIAGCSLGATYRPGGA